MKKQTSTLEPQGIEEFQAKKAIQQIQSWMEKKYPKLAASAKATMIIECLIELTEERKFTTAQG